MSSVKSPKAPKELSLGQKIFMIVCLFTLLTIAVGLEGSFLLRNVLVAAKDSYLASKTIEYIGQSTTTTNSFLYLAYAATSRAAIAPSEKLKTRDDIELAIGTMKESILDLSGQVSNRSDLKEDIKKIESDWDLVQIKANGWLKLLDSGANPALLLKELSAMEESIAQLQSPLGKLQRVMSSAVSDSYMIADRSDRTIGKLSLITLCFILMMFIVSLYVARRTSARCNDLISKIHEKSFSLLGSSSTLAGGSQKLSESSTEQAAAIQESMSAMAEMGSMIKNTTQYTEECNRITSSVETKARNGVQVMREMVSAMESIEESNAALGDISSIIEKIFERTAVINDIVFKTQLLSFNASIEAARAGQYGKGFAVVADEVGKLAVSSGAASKEISSLLNQSRREVEKIVSLTTQRVQGGKVVSNKAMEAFEGISGEINAISEQVADISRASKEQNIGVEQVGEAMREMDRASLQNSSVANDVALLSQTIKADCDDFTQIVHSFRSVILGSRKILKTIDLRIATDTKALPNLSSDLNDSSKSSASETKSLINIIAEKAKTMSDVSQSDKKDKDEHSKRSA